ncbi:YicC/YloC family endoribonuclease [Halobacillus litoralis]|uniref:YicC/YloC family endoribonuclease n=1 Tax=Halobacillus litoralis TaxID=45668 RepID=UPI001CFDBB1C|nr:YicC/YloC family endoribonuclease [Halobacillus litoralis]
MVKSMTGYGKQSVTIGETLLHVEVRSVNHRFLDISAKIPRSLLFLEERLKGLAKEKLGRGHLDIFVTVEGQGLFEKKIVVDWPVVDQYMKKLEDIQDKYDLTGQITIDMVSKLDNVFSVQEVEEHPDHLQEALLHSMTEALHSLLTMRSREGEQLEQDLRLRMANVKKLFSHLMNEDRL